MILSQKRFVLSDFGSWRSSYYGIIGVLRIERIIDVSDENFHHVIYSWLRRRQTNGNSYSTTRKQNLQ